MKRKKITPIASNDFVEFSCPFCGEYVRANLSAASIVHVKPPCKQFMHAVNQEFFKMSREKGIAAARAAFRATPNVRKVEGEN